MPGSLTQTRRQRSLIAASLPLAALAIFSFAGYRWYFTSNDAVFSALRVPPLARYAAPVVPGIYILGGLAPSVAYVVETSQGLVLIDSGLDEDASLLKSQMTAL